MQTEDGKLAMSIFTDLSGAELATFVRVVDRTLDRLHGDSG